MVHLIAQKNCLIMKLFTQPCQECNLNNNEAQLQAAGLIPTHNDFFIKLCLREGFPQSRALRFSTYSHLLLIDPSQVLQEPSKSSDLQHPTAPCCGFRMPAWGCSKARFFRNAITWMP